MADTLPERYAPYLLWCDTETTGLNHRTDTVLEVAWFITCADGIPITPIRSRYTALHPEDSPVTPGEFGTWPGGDARRYPVAKVCEMHATSGLDVDHSYAREEGNVIEHAAVIERLILDDIRQAHRLIPARNPADEADPRASTLTRIAGDGVAHFELPQFALYFPTLYRNDGGPSVLHYRPHDISSALDVITRGRRGGGTGINAILQANRYKAAALARELMVGPWPTFGLRDQMSNDPARNTAAWVDALDTPHRAAHDAVRAWAAYRLLADSGARIPWRSVPTAEAGADVAAPA